jgi:Mg-chelatase subunit ChlD
MSQILKIIFILPVLLFANQAIAEQSLSAQSSIPAGAEIKISVSEPTSKREFVTIVAPETEEGEYKSGYKYLNNKTSVSLTAPETPGNYEIRLLSGESGYPTLATKKLEVTEVTAELTAPSEIDAGAEIKIAWEGPNNSKDFITIVEIDAEEGTYDKYKYTKSSKRNQVIELSVPEVAGEYEIRYITGVERNTLARAPLSVGAVTASLEVPENIEAGKEFKVTFTGPNNSKDFITIVEKGADEGSYKKYKYTKHASDRKPLTLNAPDIPGDYEVRYLSGDKRFTLASAPLKVGGTTAKIEAVDEAMEGTEISIEWEGPDNDKDFITIVKEGAEEGTYDVYKYTRNKYGPRKLNKLKLTVPEESGAYEIRYLSGEKRLTLGTRKLQITPPSASLDAPDEVVSRDVVNVSWEGPGNNSDFVAIKIPGTDEMKTDTYAYVRRGKKLKLKAPDTPGEYEIQYVTGGKKKVLASRKILVTPSKVPGKLSVVQSSSSESTTVAANAMNIALILDASGSMLKRDQGGKNRIEVAKSAIEDLVAGPLSAGTPFAMRVFGHKEKDSCRTDLEVELSPLNKAAVTEKVRSIDAMNYAKTPIAKSLELIKEDLASAEGKRVVILVTDGEETCGGDPEAAIKELARSGFDTRVNIVGFAIDEFMLKETFRSWARIGNGNYFDASNPEELKRSIREAVRVPYEILNSKKELVSSGVVNGEPVSVLPGTYTIKVLSSPEQSIETVVVEPEKLKTVDVSSSQASS